MIPCDRRESILPSASLISDPKPLTNVLYGLHTARGRTNISTQNWSLVMQFMNALNEEFTDQIELSFTYKLSASTTESWSFACLFLNRCLNRRSLKIVPNKQSVLAVELGCHKRTPLSVMQRSQAVWLTVLNCSSGGANIATHFLRLTCDRDPFGRAGRNLRAAVREHAMSYQTGNQVGGSDRTSALGKWNPFERC